MRLDDWKTFFAAELERIEETLNAKAAEYAVGGDRLHNFKKAGGIASKNPAEALDGMVLKQYTSYRDMIDKVERSRIAPRSFDEVAKFKRAYIDEKFGDLINYFILQKALFIEMHCEEPTP